MGNKIHYTSLCLIDVFVAPLLTVKGEERNLTLNGTEVDLCYSDKLAEDYDKETSIDTSKDTDTENIQDEENAPYMAKDEVQSNEALNDCYETKAATVDNVVGVNQHGIDLDTCKVDNVVIDERLPTETLSDYRRSDIDNNVMSKATGNENTHRNEDDTETNEDVSIDLYDDTARYVPISANNQSLNHIRCEGKIDVNDSTIKDGIAFHNDQSITHEDDMEIEGNADKNDSNMNILDKDESMNDNSKRKTAKENENETMKGVEGMCAHDITDDEKLNENQITVTEHKYESPQIEKVDNAIVDFEQDDISTSSINMEYSDKINSMVKSISKHNGESNDFDCNAEVNIVDSACIKENINAMEDDEDLKRGANFQDNDDSILGQAVCIEDINDETENMSDMIGDEDFSDEFNGDEGGDESNSDASSDEEPKEFACFI